MALQKPVVISQEEVFPGKSGINTWGKTMLKRVFRYPGKGEPDDFFLWHSTREAAIVLPLTANQEVVAVRLFSQAANDFVLQLPGGVPRRGESLSDAAYRELREETGYRAGSVTALGKGWFEPFNLTAPFHAYMAMDCENVRKQTLDSTESLEVEVYPFHEWWNMCLDGTIEDAKSVLVTARTIKHIRAMDAPYSYP